MPVNSLSSANGCFFQYNHSGGKIWLRTDNGASWLGPVTMGTAATLSNSQCTLKAAASRTTVSEFEIQLDAWIVFDPSFAGAKSIYLRAEDNGGSTSGWETMGTWTPFP